MINKTSKHLRQERNTAQYTVFKLNVIFKYIKLEIGKTEEMESD